jgi:hypothetical protein
MFKLPTFDQLSPNPKKQLSHNPKNIPKPKNNPLYPKEPTKVLGKMSIDELNLYKNVKVPMEPSNETKDMWDFKDTVHVGRNVTISDLSNSKNSDLDDDMNNLLSEVKNILKLYDSRKDFKINSKRIAALNQRYDDILKITHNIDISSKQSQSINKIQKLIGQIKLVHEIKSLSPKKRKTRSRSQSASRSHDNKKQTTRHHVLTASDIERLTRSNSESNRSLHLSDLDTSK